jgi:hypothetical protein
MFLALDKYENWFTIGLMLAVWIVVLHLLAQFGIHIGSYLGLSND